MCIVGVVMVFSLKISGMLSRVCRNKRYCEMIYLGINDVTNLLYLHKFPWNMKPFSWKS